MEVRVLIIKSDIQLYIECQPKEDLGNMEEFIKNFNGLLKVEIENFIGYGEDDIKYINIGVRTNVSS